MIQSIIVLGGGSAGLIAALGLQARLPQAAVTVVRSSKIGVIGVGEGTTVKVPMYLHGELRIPQGEFFKAVDPLVKRGVRFLSWGPRPHYDFAFGPNTIGQAGGLPKPYGYYCDDDFSHTNTVGSLMAHDRFFTRDGRGLPVDDRNYGYHFENEKLVAFLERSVLAEGIAVVDDELKHAALNEAGVESLHLASGKVMRADLYVDASGFASELLGKALGEAFIPFDSSLYCKRAVVGSFERAGDPVHAYTTAETMDAGWCWQIEHRHRITRGYVYAPDFISDEAAEVELRRKNPRVGQTRIVKFASGRYQNAWRGNVVAIGNAAGFVEPLEATALATLCEQTSVLARHLVDTGGCPTPATVAAYNTHIGRFWDRTRWFLAMHYKFNTRLDTPFWRAARADTNIGPLEEFVALYRELGPSLLVARQWPDWEPEGLLTHLVGMKVPYRNAAAPKPWEMKLWEMHRQTIRTEAANGLTLPEWDAFLARVQTGGGPQFPAG